MQDRSKLHTRSISGHFGDIRSWIVEQHSTSRVKSTSFTRWKSTSAMKLRSGIAIEANQHSIKPRKKRLVKKIHEVDYKDILEIPGVVKIVLSERTQKMLFCFVGEDVTAENPCIKVLKETLEYDMDAREDICEFSVMRDKITQYPNNELLLGYIPDETKNYDEFYICVTVTAEATVTKILDQLKSAQEKRLMNSIFKSVGRWKGYGSEKEIDKASIKRNRLNIEVELEGSYPFFAHTAYTFRLIFAKNIMDRYVDILPLRLSFSNLAKSRLSKASQVAPSLTDVYSQTTYAYPNNASTEYEFECPFIQNTSKEMLTNFREFVDTAMDEFEGQLVINSAINLYHNDYVNIVRNPKTQQSGEKARIAESISVIDLNLRKGVGVSGAVWHPLWSGVFAVMYSDHPLCSYRKERYSGDNVHKATFEIPPVAIWSFVDTLNPSLYLESPSEVTCLAFCPFHEYILVGGCCSGQILIWDLTGKLEKAETSEVLSNDQQQYRNLMHSLMDWMKNTNNPRLVPATVVSSLRHSHSGTVTSVSWLCPFVEINRRGKIVEIPEDEERTSMQFVTCGHDGNVMVWDLNAEVVHRSAAQIPRRKKRVKYRPPALIANLSPYRELHRYLRPIYQGIITAPGTNRRLPITAMVYRKSKREYVERYPDPNRKYSFSNRILFNPVTGRPSGPLMQEFIIGTGEGNFAFATWSGFDVNTGASVNKEVCKFKSFATYHDGPIVSIARCTKYPDLILTVGGKVFAVWHVDLLTKPVIWRKGREKYTHGVWYRLCNSVIRLSRHDGCMEIWDLALTSSCFNKMRRLSAYPVTITTTNRRLLPQNYFVLGDMRGFCRIFLLSRLISSLPEKYQAEGHKLCNRERARKILLDQWQAKWSLDNAELLKMRAEKEITKCQEDEEEFKKKRALFQLEVIVDQKQDAGAEEVLGPPVPGKYEEWAKSNYLISEKKRMAKYLLLNKALDVKHLEKQRQPLIKLKQQQQKTSLKLQKYMDRGESNFNTAVNILFPEARKNDPPALADPYASGDIADDRRMIMEQYNKVAEESKEYVGSHRYRYKFDWGDVLRTGKVRRRALDGYYNRYNHDARFGRQGNVTSVSKIFKNVQPVISGSGDSMISDNLSYNISINSN